MNKDIDIKKLLKKNYTYPDPEDDEFLTKIFKKREFHFHKIPRRDKLSNYEDIKEYRDSVCAGEFKLREQQNILTNFMSPYTQYHGILVIHGTGTGKTCSAISIAEQFKDQVRKYNTKIYVLTFGPTMKEGFKDQLLFCTGETYLKNKEALNQMSKEEINLEKRIALNNSLQYYKILSYKTFYRKVLGEKIRITDKKEGEKAKISYKKTKDGEIEREVVIDRISNMNNSILIVDEAHNLTGNEYGEALKKIIKSSTNLKVILLTATPMKNLADDIVELLNFIRPKNDKILREKIFTSDKNYEMKFKEGGEEYIKKKAKGYISFFRGNRPYTFAERVDKGVIPPGLLYTPVIRCQMAPFQLKTYEKTAKDVEDALDRNSSAAANFVFPALDDKSRSVKGVYSNDGIDLVLSQLNSNGDLLRKKINQELFNGKLSEDIEKNFIGISDRKNITGNILKFEYLQQFSSKFHTALKKLNKLIYGKKGAGTAFVYCNLTRAGGILIFQEILLMNGYLDYQDNSRDYEIKDTTIDAVTGKTFSQMKKEKKDKEFFPATFITITGGTEEVDDIPEEKQRIVREVFNNSENISGTKLKFILGSKVMNEGVTLENVREIHILDVHYNLAKVDQAIGRGIRECKHMNVINNDYRFPQVHVFRYVVSIKKGLTTDEILYQKAERKYILVKKVERVLKEVAVDCPLLLHGNMFPEEIDKFKGCVEPTIENVEKGKKICPALCDFQKCDIKCDEKKLNEKYWNEKDQTYNKLNKNELDYDTFNQDLARSEIDIIKEKIKDLFRISHVYTYDQIFNTISNSYQDYQKDLFEHSFLDQALEDILPVTENDFNNFRDTVHDKYNNPGYLIQRGFHYIFQPFNQNENVPMYYREKFDNEISNKVSLEDYNKVNFSEHIQERKETITENKGYDFESNIDYYINRNEYDIVGIIDKNPSKNDQDSLFDVFKVRNKRDKILDKKRGTGIPTMKGAVCTTAKDKKELVKLLKKLPNMSDSEIERLKILKREDMCSILQNKLMDLEKNSTGKTKMTYMMIPANHPLYPFPYNLDDRIKSVKDKIKKLSSKDIEFKVDKNKDSYTLSFKDAKHMQSIIKNIKELGGNLEGSTWIFKIE
jgi:superfamily II DNA or RNA helicase